MNKTFVYIIALLIPFLVYMIMKTIINRNDYGERKSKKDYIYEKDIFHKSTDILIKATSNIYISDILVKKNQLVKKGEPLLIMEKQKMNITVNAPQDAYVSDIFCNSNDSYTLDEILMVLSPMNLVSKKSIL